MGGWGPAGWGKGGNGGGIEGKYICVRMWASRHLEFCAVYHFHLLMVFDLFPVAIEHGN